MSIKLKSTPITVTLSELKTGINNTEDAGYELISVTKGTAAGESLNVVTFSERTEEIVGEVELFPAKVGASEADINAFFEQLSDKGYSFICYADVFIESHEVPL